MELENKDQLIIEGGPMGSKVVVEKMSLNKIKTSRNSRKTISDSEIEGLMQSIKETGLLQPIGVVKNGTGYEICYGNRRFIACSKLGFSHIPVIVHEKQKESDIDIKNLTENIQRRNITLAEAGRYVELLKQQGLSHGEIAVRLGVPKGYVDTCAQTWKEVPKQFREHTEVKVRADGKNKTTPGKIALYAAKQISTARRRHKLNEGEVMKLFQAAKSNGPKFKPEHISTYVSSMREGNEDFVEAVPETKQINLQFTITQAAYDKLHMKYVEAGPFKSVTGVIYAIIEGKISHNLTLQRKR